MYFHRRRLLISQSHDKEYIYTINVRAGTGYFMDNTVIWPSSLSRLCANIYVSDLDGNSLLSNRYNVIQDPNGEYAIRIDLKYNENSGEHPEISYMGQIISDHNLDPSMICKVTIELWDDETNGLSQVFCDGTYINCGEHVGVNITSPTSILGTKFSRQCDFTINLGDLCSNEIQIYGSQRLKPRYLGVTVYKDSYGEVFIKSTDIDPTNPDSYDIGDLKLTYGYWRNEKVVTDTVLIKNVTTHRLLHGICVSDYDDHLIANRKWETNINYWKCIQVNQVPVPNYSDLPANPDESSFIYFKNFGVLAPGDDGYNGYGYGYV